MISLTEKLRDSLKYNLITLSIPLLANGLISTDDYSILRNRYIAKSSRAARLVELLQQKVKLDVFPAPNLVE